MKLRPIHLFYALIGCLLIPLTLLLAVANTQANLGATIVVESRIDTTLGDVEERDSDGAIDIDSTDLELVDDPAFNGDQTVGLRFTNINVPQGATITSAYIEFEVDEVSTGTTNLEIRVQDVGDAPAFAGADFEVTSRTYTTFTVDWSNVTGWDTVSAKQQTPSLISLVQYLVDRGDWVSGNSVVFFFDGSGERVAESYDGESANAPLLHIEYTDINPTPTPPPTPLPTPIPGQTVVIGLVGDYGDDSQAEEDVAELIDSWTPDYVVTVGDNRYGISDFDLAVGKYYCDYINGAQSGTHCPTGGNAAFNRFFPTVGNHEYSDGNGVSDYLDYFAIPGAGAISSHSSGTELYYDFMLGPVHFFSLNSETDEGDTSAQAVWLQTQMQASPAPWQVVILHRSTYTSVARGNRGGYMRWPYEAWGADIVINGDDHFYERLAIGDLYYVVNGAGGRSLYEYGTIDPASLVRFNDDYGALRLVATDDALDFEYYSRDDVLWDSFSLPENSAECRTISLPASADTWIDSNNPTTNYGTATELQFDGSPDQGVLMRWDFSAIPAGATLQSAPILTLDLTNTSISTYELYEVTQAWTELGATWSTVDGSNAWPGGAGALGDVGVQIGATDGGLLNDKDNIIFNAAGEALVQGWLDGTTANNGLLIADYVGPIDGADAYYRSHLTFDYCSPPPTVTGLNSAETQPPYITMRLLVLFILVGIILGWFYLKRLRLTDTNLP